MLKPRWSRRSPCLIAIGLLASAPFALGACSSAPAETAEETPRSAAYRIESENCAATLTGRSSGVAIGPDLLATVAHGIRERGTLMVRDASGIAHPGTVVYLDPEKDIALIKTDEPTVAAVPLAEPEVGSVTVLGYPDADGGPQPEVATISRLTYVTLDGEGRRAAARLNGDINPGDSGAAVINAEGEMVGMVFASTRGADKGWAISAIEIADAVETLASNGPSAPPTDC